MEINSYRQSFKELGVVITEEDSRNANECDYMKLTLSGNLCGMNKPK